MNENKIKPEKPTEVLRAKLQYRNIVRHLNSGTYFSRKNSRLTLKLVLF